MAYRNFRGNLFTLGLISAVSVAVALSSASCSSTTDSASTKGTSSGAGGAASGSSSSSGGGGDGGGFIDPGTGPFGDFPQDPVILDGLVPGIAQLFEKI